MFGRLKKVFDRVKDLSASVERYQKETDKQTIPSLAYVNRAKKLIDKCRFEEAIGVLNEALEISPKDALVYKYLGTAFEKAGDFETAINAYRQSAGFNPQDKNIWHKLGMALVTTRQYEEAEKAFEKADKITPINTDIQTGWGMSLYKQKKYKEAHEKFLKAIQINRCNFSAMLLAAIVEIRLKKYDDADKKLMFLIGANPNESCTYEYANLSYLRGNYDDAIVYAEKSLGYNKNMLPSYLLLGEIYSRRFDYENSTKYFEAAKDNELVNALLYKEWGDALVRLNRFVEAKEMYYKALVEDLEFIDAQAGMALCSAETGDFEKASDLIPIVEEKESENLKIKEAKGVCAFAFGETGKALEIFKDVLKNDKDRTYNYFRLAKCYEKLNNDAMACDAFEKLIKFNPNFAGGYLEFAKYLISKEDYKDAQRKLRKAANLQPKNQEILNLLFYTGYILVKQNVCEYNIKEAISLADTIEQFQYPELRAELETLLKSIK